MYKYRNIETNVCESLEAFRIVRFRGGAGRIMYAASRRTVCPCHVTGPRQSGKTTLTRMAFPDKPYVSLESPDERMAAIEDPRSFLARFPDGAILDEAQRAPDIFSYMQQLLDDSKRPGRFIITGSQHLGLTAAVSQSLAGRVALLELLPFTRNELRKGDYASEHLETTLFNGSYPPPFDQKIETLPWYDSYIDSYLERDVRQIINVRNLFTFRRFLTLCAGSMGQLFNATRLGNDCGITSVTAGEWLSVLEGTYITFRLQPWHTNLRKRVVKTPKLYFWETAIALRLLGIQSPTQLLSHPLRGAIFENWVVSEYLKQQLHRGVRPNLYFWRDSSGLEVDLLHEDAASIKAFEIKSGATFAADWTGNLQKWCDLADMHQEVQTHLIYGGTKKFDFKGSHVSPWHQLPELS